MFLRLAATAIPIVASDEACLSMSNSLTEDAESQTIGAALREGRRMLTSSQTESPGLDAEVLLRHALGIDRTKLFASLPERIDPRALATFRRLLASRAEGMPVAYLIGQREFMGFPFIVRPGVLIPRPETEILVEWAIRWLRARDRATVIDVGAGSGAIVFSVALSLGADWPGRFIATDISPEALLVARENRDHFRLTNRVELSHASLVAGIDEQVDLILANLPYLRPEQISSNPELAAEPRLALDGGPDGLVLIHNLLDDAPRIVTPGGAVGLEIDPEQRDAVIELARRAFPAAEIAVLKDLAGLDRHIIVLTA